MGEEVGEGVEGGGWEEEEGEGDGVEGEVGTGLSQETSTAT